MREVRKNKQTMDVHRRKPNPNWYRSNYKGYKHEQTIALYREYI